MNTTITLTIGEHGTFRFYRGVVLIPDHADDRAVEFLYKSEVHGADSIREAQRLIDRLMQADKPAEAA